MKKMFKSVAMALGIMGVGALSFGGSNAEAAISDPAGWQVKQTNYIDPSSNTYGLVETSPVAYSGGGNIGIRVPAHTVMSFGGDTAVLEARVYEKDSHEANLDDKLGSVYFYPRSQTGTVTKTISGVKVDGADGSAEIYVKWYANYRSATSFPTYILD
jgi:hypothetical protein